MNDDRGHGIVIGLLVAILFAIGFVAFSEQAEREKPRDGKRVNIDIDLNRRRPCPDGRCPVKYIRSLADIPVPLREENYDGGSCVHASLVTLLRWQGQFELADWWREEYNEGEYLDRVIKRMEAAGLRYAVGDFGDEEFLEWACRNRLGAVIFFKPYHSINIVGMNDTTVTLLDNNHIFEYEVIPRDKFMYAWKNYFGGVAFTPVYTPAPPYPDIK